MWFLNSNASSSQFAAAFRINQDPEGEIKEFTGIKQEAFPGELMSDGGVGRWLHL